MLIWKLTGISDLWCIHLIMCKIIYMYINFFYFLNKKVLTLLKTPLLNPILIVTCFSILCPGKRIEKQTYSYKTQISPLIRVYYKVTTIISMKITLFWTQAKCEIFIYSTLQRLNSLNFISEGRLFQIIMTELISKSLIWFHF